MPTFSSEENKYYCYYCGDEISEPYYDEEGNICCDCCREEKVHRCSRCGEIVDVKEDGVFFDPYGDYGYGTVCAECFKDMLLCEKCDEYFFPEDCEEIFEEYHTCICVNCAESEEDEED